MRRLACLFVLVTAGCGADPSARLIGKWEGRVDGVEEAAEKTIAQAKTDQASDPQKDALAKRMVVDMLEKLRIHDEFRADGTCVSTAGGKAVDGTWKFISESGDGMIIERKPNRSLESAKVMLRFDGPDTFRLETSEDGMTIVFTRQK